ncbi:hypothetical protein LX36DRAFT_372063 [Colletotrichum falcatum]|nr:hypothetical protein LX36DRAFT_372063 [Colletotrichum falcatum]
MITECWFSSLFFFLSFFFSPSLQAGTSRLGGQTRCVNSLVVRYGDAFDDHLPVENRNELMVDGMPLDTFCLARRLV